MKVLHCLSKKKKVAHYLSGLRASINDKSYEG